MQHEAGRVHPGVFPSFAEVEVRGWGGEAGLEEGGLLCRGWPSGDPGMWLCLSGPLLSHVAIGQSLRGWEGVQEF
jgi:hypothetical protein